MHAQVAVFNVTLQLRILGKSGIVERRGTDE